MAYEVSRRSFLKGAAALAAATAASGLLTACGGGKNDAGVVVGDYKLYFEDLKYGRDDSEKVYYITPTIQVKREDGKGIRSVKYRDAFQKAQIDKQELKLSNGTETFGPLSKKEKAYCKPRFTLTDEAVYNNAVNNGTPVQLTIVLSGKEALFEVNVKTGSVKLVVVK